MIRNKLFRRFVISTTLFMGLFTQFQSVFACEYKDGKLQSVCCCDKSGEISRDCAENDRCDDQQATHEATLDNCCDVSYQAAPGATAISSTPYSQQVLLLDAPQPPPLLARFEFQTLTVSTPTFTSPRNTSTRVSGTQTYQLTQRYRI